MTSRARVTRRVAIGLALLSVVAVTLVIPAGAVPRDVPRVQSVVVLGDSVASGEGTLDGYVYEDRALLPAWTAAARARQYGGQYPDCHQSARAYGHLVARALGATDTSFACSGASFTNGIVDPPVDTRRTLGPAQFGDWAQRDNLNPSYDHAQPDLVLVTAGANTVGFERAFAYCVLASRGLTDSEAAAIANSASVVDAVATAISTAVRSVTGSRPSATAPVCTANNPGSYLQRTVLDRVGDVTAEASALAQAVRERGRADGKVPEVVFTTYPDPLPATAAGFALCPDAAALGTAQVAFMHQMLQQMNGALRTALASVPGTSVADPDPAFAGHRWCDADPWFFGPSILLSNPSSWAPFHPTTAGQRAIADSVLATVRGAPAAPVVPPGAV